MENLSLSTKEGAIDFMRHQMEAMRELLARDGEARPVAFVFLTRDPKTGEDLPEPGAMLVPLDGTMGSGEAKDRAAALLRALCVKGRGVGVGMMMETWMSHMTEEEHRAWGGRSLEHLPQAKRSEKLWVTLEHVQLPQPAAWTAPIARDANGQPRAGEFERLEGGMFKGRFAELFAREEWQ